ncbi:MAG: tetratricopeptide repeat protein [Planctomycetota bacterium]|jgi:Tfp pilus assembly protein PilF
MRTLSAGLLLLVAGVAGCGKSTAEILLEREQVKYHTTNAQGYLDSGEWARARQQAEKALELDSEYAKARAILGFTLFQLAGRLDQEKQRNEVDDFLEESEEALVQVTRDADKTDVAVFKAYYGLGLVHQFRWERANSDLDAARRSVADGDPSVSKSDLEALQAAVTKHVDLAVRYYHNSLLTSMQRFDGAREALIKALYYRGRTNPGGRDYERAIELADDYLDKARTDAQVKREDLPKIEKDGSLSEAQKAQAKLAIEARLRRLTVNRVRMHDLKAQMLAKRGDWPGVIRTLNSALQIDADYSLLHYGLGLAYAKNGDLAESHDQLVQFAALRRSARRALEEERERLKATHAGEDEINAVRTRVDVAKADEFKLSLLIALVSMQRRDFEDARRRVDGLLLTAPESVALQLVAAIRALEARQTARARELLRHKFEGRIEREHPTFADVLELSRDLRAALGGKPGRD